MLRPGSALVSTFDLLKQAIMARSRISASYDGLPRIACPHVLGHDKQGRPKVLLYQVGGLSASGLHGPRSGDDWRCLFVTELTDVALEKGLWYTPGNYQLKQKGCITRVVAAI